MAVGQNSKWKEKPSLAINTKNDCHASATKDQKLGGLKQPKVTIFSFAGQKTTMRLTKLKRKLHACCRLGGRPSSRSSKLPTSSGFALSSSKSERLVGPFSSGLTLNAAHLRLPILRKLLIAFSLVYFRVG